MTPPEQSVQNDVSSEILAPGGKGHVSSLRKWRHEYLPSSAHERILRSSAWLWQGPASLQSRGPGVSDLAKVVFAGRCRSGAARVHAGLPVGPRVQAGGLSGTAGLPGGLGGLWFRSGDEKNTVCRSREGVHGRSWAFQKSCWVGRSPSPLVLLPSPQVLISLPPFVHGAP